MYILAKLVFLNYIPEKFERNMRFRSPSGEIYGFIYTTTPLEQLIEKHGYPVVPYILPISANPDEHVEPLVHPEQIGWWDEGPQSDELRDVTNADLTRVMLEEDGYLQLEVSVRTLPNGTEFITPELYENKATFGIAIDQALDFDEAMDELEGHCPNYEEDEDDE